MTGLKDRQRLALYVALGLSAGSGLTLDASTAYANPDNDNIHVTVLSTDPDFSTKYASGVNATNETSSVKDNVVTIGRKSPVDTPAINGDVVGGYSDAYAVTHNTVTVDDMTLALAKSVFGGLADGDKAADDNEVTINGGTYAGSNVVYGGKSDTGTATHNKVTINGGTYDGSNAVYGGRTSGTVATTGNEVIINGGHFGSNTDVYGGESAGGTAEGAAATGNTVTITGGVFDGGNIYGGNTTGTATTTRRSSDNKVYLGAENGAYSADLTHVNIRGAKDAHTANKLFVRASGVTVGSLDNFDEYHFQLTQPTAGAVGVPVGSTMLAIGGTGGFGSNANVTMNSLHLDASEWNKDKQLYGNVGTVGLVVANGQHLAIHPVPSTNSMKRNGESGDFEYELTTDATATQEGTYVSAEVHRNCNAEITFRGNAAAGSELYAGYSAYGNNAEKNHLTVTNVPKSTAPAPGLSAAYGAKIVGEGGSAHGNVLEITGTREKNLPYAENRIASAYGAAITNAHNAGVVGGTADGEGNHVTVSDGIVDNVYGGATQGTGAVVHNTATITGGTVTNVYGGQSTGDGAVASNEVHISRGTVGTTSQTATVYGGAATGSGDVTGNAVTLTGGTVIGKVVAGAAGTGKVEHNYISLGDESNRNLDAAMLAAAELIGSEGGNSPSDNKLKVYAKNAKVKSVDHFTAYDFDLGTNVHDGDRMLTVVNAGAFDTAGNGVALADISATTANLAPNAQNVWGRVTLIESGTSGTHLKFDAAERELAETNTHEFALHTDSGTTVTDKLLLDYNRYHGGKVVHDANTPIRKVGMSPETELYGGLSRTGHTTDDNELTIHHLAADLTSAYGGKNEGTTGNVQANRVTVNGTTAPSPSTTEYAVDKVYGGAITNANNAGVVGGTRTVDGKTVEAGNSVIITGGAVHEVYGGYTTGTGDVQNNNVTIAKGNIGSLYGGKVEGERGIAKNNIVVLTQEAEGIAGTVTQNTYGGVATGDGGTAAGNRVIITAGTAHDVYGGMVSGGVSAGTPNKVSTADGNIVQMIGGSAANVYGGDALNAADGTSSGNKVSVTGGTVNGNIAGARAKYNATNAVSNGNTVTFGAEDGNHRPLGATFAAGTTVYGTNYRDASGDVTFDSNDAAVAGNTLNVNAKDVTVGTVRNFENFNFNLGDTAKDGDVMLSLTQAGGFGTTSGSTSAPVKVDWTKVKADTSHLSTVRGQGAHGKNTITLMRETVSTAAGDLLNFANYTVAAADYSGTDRDYETKMHTDGNAASTESVVLELNRFRNDSVLHDGTTQPDAVYGGYSAYDDTAVDANGDHLGHTTENNMLGITGVASGTNNLKAYGGYAGGDHGGAVNNHVNVNIQNTTPGVLDSVYGGYASGAHAGVVRGNTATLDSGIIADILAGGYADSTGVDHNEVHIYGGTVGTYIDPSTVSTVTHAAKVYGGYGTTATDNTVEILAGTLTGNVYGGYATTAGTPATTGASPTAEVSALRNNKVTLRDGVTVTGNVYGAYAAANASNMTAATDSNTIDLYKAVIDGTLYGGMAQDGAGSGKNNTLAVYARGAKADDFVGVQNLRFYVPAGTTAADKETMLTLDNVAAPAGAAAGAPTTKDLSHVNVGVQLAGNRPSLKVGDAVSLMKVYKGNTTNAAHAVAITSDTPLVNKATGMQGISLRYNFDLLTREAEAGSGKNNELYATVTSASVNPDTKSLVETRAASLAFLTSGSDLLTDAAMTAAMEAAATPASESQAGRARVDGAPKEYRMWAVQNVSSMRLNSGSHVDAKGWGLNLGFAKQRVSGRNTLTYGPFVEYGKGSYDSYLDDGLHGSGNMDYLGVGVMAKSQSENGAYVEGSVRVGRVKSDYAGTIDNTHTTYDSSSTYYAGHLGVGQEKQLKNGNTIETYAKYFFTHQGGDTAKLSTGEVYDFDAADSHRIRFGTRYTSKKGDASFYTGLAYEYEFGNDIAASFEGYNTPSPSLTGGTGILELGYRFTPQNGRATYGIQLMGMTGKRRGISGGVQMHWAF